MARTSDKPDGPTAGTHTFAALEFLALLLTHVPDHHEVLVRYYGAYSVRRRAAWRSAGLLSEVRPDDAKRDDLPPRPQLLALRKRSGRSERFKPSAPTLASPVSSPVCPSNPTETPGSERNASGSLVSVKSFSDRRIR